MGWGKSIGAFVDGWAKADAEKRKAENEQWKRDYMTRQDSREQELQPGKLKEQDFRNQHLSLQNQTLQEDLNAKADAKAKIDAVTGAVDEANTAGRTAREKSVLESVQPVSPSGTDEAGQPPKWKTIFDPNATYDTQDLALQRARTLAPSILSYINTDHVDKVRTAAIKANNPEFADKYATWLKTPQAQEGVRHFADSQAYAVVGAHEPALNSLISAYNTKGYSNDGHRAEKVGMTVDPKTGVATYQLRFINNATGQVVNQVSVRSDEIHRLSGAFLAPEVVAKANYERVKADQDAEREAKKTQAATQGRMEASTGAAFVKNNMATMSSDTSGMAYFNAVAKKIDNLSKTVVGFAQLPFEEQKARAEAEVTGIPGHPKPPGSPLFWLPGTSPTSNTPTPAQSSPPPPSGRNTSQLPVNAAQASANGQSIGPYPGTPGGAPQAAAAPAASDGRSIGTYPGSAAPSAPPAEGALVERGLPPDMAPGGKTAAPAADASLSADNYLTINGRRVSAAIANLVARAVRGVEDMRQRSIGNYDEALSGWASEQSKRAQDSVAAHQQRIADQAQRDREATLALRRKRAERINKKIDEDQRKEDEERLSYRQSRGLPPWDALLPRRYDPVYE